MKHKTLTFAVAALALGCAGAFAAIFPAFTAEELAAQAQLILQGNIVRSWTAWDPDHKYIWTHYEVSVTDQIRGSRLGTVTVSEPGGSLDGVHQQINGLASYSTGENVVLFLFKTPIGYWRTVGGPQGKFTIEQAGRVHANVSATALVQPQGRPAGTTLSSLQGLRVADFKSRVRQLASANPFRGQQ